MDNELFELCKEVYKRTELPITLGMFHFNKDGHVLMRSYRGGVAYFPENGDVPFYTSDYLLEKLPKFSPFTSDAYLTVMEKQTPKDRREDFYWTAGYFSGYGWGHTGQSDTPLKALLKLTIALDDAGVKL